MQMVQAVKAGHDIKGVSKETTGKLHQAANSMSDKQLKDFSHVAKKPQKGY